MNLLPIGEVARRTGLRPSAIIRFAQDAGFTLQEIKVLLRGPAPDRGLGARWRRLAESKLEELDALAHRVSQMRRAINAGLRCGCAGVEDCVLCGLVGASPRARIPRITRTMRWSAATW